MPRNVRITGKIHSSHTGSIIFAWMTTETTRAWWESNSAATVSITGAAAGKN